MAIFDEGVYTITEASEFIEIPVRTIQRLCKKHNLEIRDGRYIITGKQLKQWKQERANAPKTTPHVTTQNDMAHTSETPEEEHQRKLKEAIELITIEAAKQNVTHKVFTEEEYRDIIGTLEIVSFQEEQIKYLRDRIDKQDAALSNLFKTIEQRNYIDAKKNEQKN